MSFKVTLFTLYPEMFPGTLGESLAGSALKSGQWQLECIDLRSFGEGKHKCVDDTPAGGGAGMVMRVDILCKAIDAVLPKDDMRPRFVLSPRGRVWSQGQAREMSAGEGVVLLCGRFEGVDERFFEARGFSELSIGDFILSGGEVAAQVVLDSVVRLLPDVMGNIHSEIEESFENDLLEYPHYTRPRDFEGMSIPEVLLSGNHGAIAKWRAQRSIEITEQRRPDLLIHKNKK